MSASELYETWQRVVARLGPHTQDQFDEAWYAEVKRKSNPK